MELLGRPLEWGWWDNSWWIWVKRNIARGGRKLSLNCLFGGRNNYLFDLLSSSQELITELVHGSPGGGGRVMCVLEGQGVDGHVGDDFLCFLCLSFHNGLKWC